MLLEFGELAEGYARASIERSQMDLDENAYAVYTILKTVTEKINPKQARTLNGVFEEFPDYQWDERQRSELRGNFYKILISIVEKTSDRIKVANALLDLKRI